MTRKVILENVTMTSTLTGEEIKEKYGNGIVRIHCDGGSVSIKDCNFNQECYNVIEIGYADGLGSLSNIDIENCKFNAKLINNAISIFNLGENAVINIKNCYFKDVSNCLRISNENYNKNVTINIENCSVDNWGSNTRYAGFLCMQDYTSSSMKESFEKLAFGPHMKINFKNLKYQGTKLTGNLDDLISHFNKKKTQLAYMYISNGLAHDVTYINNKIYFPTITLS